MNHSRTRSVLAGLALAPLVVACAQPAPTQRYGFITRIGRDTVALESVARTGNTVVVEGIDRFPRVRRRHAEIELASDGVIRRLVMDIDTPSDGPKQRERHVVAVVTNDSVHITKTDSTGTVTRGFNTNGAVAMAHVPMMYSLYELYFQAALARAANAKRTAGDTIMLRQFYIDREFDRFPLHHGVVQLQGAGKAAISHDWLAGSGDATFDSLSGLLTYSGARSTYDVRVTRLAEAPDVRALAEQFEALEAKTGLRQLSVRDTARATIGGATLSVTYGRPLARGRELLGNSIPYERVWRTGANEATHFSTSAPIALAGMELPAGTYTLWTLPHMKSVELIVNTQTGQWGTGYGPLHDLGRAPMRTEQSSTPVEQFTIAFVPGEGKLGALVMSWGPFVWSAPIVVK